MAMGEDCLATERRIAPDIVAHELVFGNSKEAFGLEAGFSGNPGGQNLDILSRPLQNRDLLHMAAVLQPFQSWQGIFEGPLDGHARPQARVEGRSQSHGRLCQDGLVKPQNGGNALSQQDIL